jgi:type II secretory pathway pseudopilin PulG
MQPARSTGSPRGTTLTEALIAVGVLAVAVPLVFGSLAEAGRSAAAAEAETRSTWIVDACMEEIRASRDGKPRFFTATQTGESFPTDGEAWALGFSGDGSLVGKVQGGDYENGLKELDGKNVRYLASMRATRQTSTSTTGANSAASDLLLVRITLEHPAAAPAAKRTKLDFHTLIP